MRGVGRAVAAVVVAIVAACGAPPPDSPSAVIRIDPEHVCEGDGYATEIAISGRESAPRLSLVPVPPGPDDPPLTYAWSFSGGSILILEGDLDDPELRIATAGDRPVHVELTVGNGEGEATVVRTIGITVPDPASGVCDEQVVLEF